MYRLDNPGPTSGTITVPILPHSLQHEALLHNHDAPDSGHQGADKTLERLYMEAYWVSMASDVDRHCQEYSSANNANYLLLSEHLSPVSPLHDHGE